MNVGAILQEFKIGAQRLYGTRLRGVILYGSWARGDAGGQSDIDILVVLDGQVTPGREVDRLMDVITDINLKYGVLVSVVPVSAEEYARVNSPLLLNVRREGIPA